MKTASKINAVWHKVHRMPKKASTDQRIEWHLAHLKNCACRTDITCNEVIKKICVVFDSH
jgi:hypothetical protein